jgi:hypothetical protein
MRCRNCHTVMMDTDPECPSCHSSAASATAAPPQPMNNSSGMANLLPVFGVFGGAIGGALYAGLMMACSETKAPSGGPGGPPASSGSSSIKRIFGVLLIVVGGLFLMLALVHFCATLKIAHREPVEITAAELCRTKNTESAPAWIAYTFTESKPTELTVTRRRLGNGGDAQARCLLVRVDDKWLVATVAAGFEGDRLVGRLVPLDSPATESLFERVRQLDRQPAALLPYEFNSVDGSASELGIRYTAAGIIAFFGLLGLWLGVHLFRRGPQPAPVPAAAAMADWTYHPLPSR